LRSFAHEGCTAPRAKTAANASNLEGVRSIPNFSNPRFSDGSGLSMDSVKTATLNDSFYTVHDVFMVHFSRAGR
jgi:hypothetical protein